MKLIVGLGNPGTKYEKTRHNIGFEIIDLLAKELRTPPFKDKFQGSLSEISLNGEKILFLKPQTYMNLSGDSVSAIIKFYKIEKKDILIIFDDMDLPLGKIRFKTSGSAGGHNGIKSIISHIGQDFSRVKCGIGKAISRDENIDFVLGRFSKEEQLLVDEMSKAIILCTKDFIEEQSHEKIMQKYNKK
ncbi:MAG: aminoacyl-tRNA hydrolase [Fusobacteriaceae bacterium]